MLAQTLPAECECCDTTLASLRALEPKQTLVHKFGMWICPSCLKVELDAQAANNTKDAQNRRIAEMNSRMQSNRNEPTELKEELFNKDTLAIVELRKQIEADSSIPADKKISTLAEQLHTTFTSNADAIFDARTLISEKGNEQKAIRSYMDTLANQLKAEERAKYELKDRNYTPTPSGRTRIRLPKPSTKPSGNKPATSQTSKKSSYNLTEAKSMCAKHGVSTDLTPAIKLLMDNQGLTLEQAVLRLKK